MAIDEAKILQSHRAVAPLRNAILRIDPSGTLLTSNHLAMVNLALESRSFDAAVPVLEKAILCLPASNTLPKPKYLCDMSLNPTAYITAGSSGTGLTTKLKYQEVLEYFFYSGLIFIGLRKWESALHCLEIAVTYPTKQEGVSKIMVEAYKKWVLVSLLLEGRLLNLPRTTSSFAAKTYHVLGRPYESLAQIFESGTASRLKSEADAGNQVWMKDCNVGLVLNVLAAYQKFQIRSLANIYSKISIPEIVGMTTSAEIGSKLNSPQAMETLIQSMISQGELHATMSSSPGQNSILTFSPSGPVLDEAHTKKELASSKERIVSLTKVIKQTDRMLTHDKDYIKHIQKQRKNVKSGSEHGIAVTDMDWNGAVEDEDIMDGGVY